MTLGTLAPTAHAHGIAALKGLNELPGSDNSTTRKKLAEIMRHLVRMRDGLIAQRHGSAEIEHLLMRTNAIISSLFGTEFPVSGFNKRRIDETRTALETLLGMPATGAASPGNKDALRAADPVLKPCASMQSPVRQPIEE
jgi:hypothetical protein